jgi:hypothetical protein
MQKAVYYIFYFPSGLLSTSLFFIYDTNDHHRYRHENNVGIKKIFPNIAGTRVAFLDNNNNGFIYNPVNDHVLKIPKFPGLVYMLFETDR